MAIKLPDPGNGIPEQKTGNDEWTNMKIVRDNFADQSNAASRLVGTGTGDLLEAGVNGIAGAWDRRTVTNREKPSTLMGTGLSLSLDGGDASSPYTGTSIYSSLNIFPFGASNGSPAFHRITLRDSRVYVQRASGDLQNWDKSAEFYTTGNTTTDSNKNIKSSSPVVRVFSDHLDKIHEANDLPIKYTRNGVGDYTIEGTTGLRENDWQIVIPEDDHRNQLVAFTIEDDNGTIRLKTYKRIFSMETFTFGPDLKTPMEIPEGRWVDLHFNDLPEQTDEPTI